MIKHGGARRAETPVLGEQSKVQQHVSKSFKRGTYLDSINAQETMRVMNFLNDHNAEDGFQVLYISSAGGDTHAAYALFQFLLRYELPLEIRIFGTCMSAAVLFVAAQDNAKISLHIDPGTHFMIHETIYYLEGSSKEVRSHMTHALVWQEQTFNKHYERALDLLGVSKELREKAKAEDVHFIY